MGIDLMTYRVRIGLQAIRAARRKRAHVSHFDASLQRCTALCVVAIMIGLICGQLVHTAAVSGWPQGLTVAFSGHRGHLPVKPPVSCSTVTMSDYVSDLSGLIALSGDVESNPGPSPLEQEQIDQIVRTLREAMKSDFEGLRTEIRSLARKMDRMEADLTEQLKKAGARVEGNWRGPG